MITVEDGYSFHFEDADWQRIAEAGGIPVGDWDMRYDLESRIDRWLAEPSPEQMRRSIANNDRVASAAGALLRAIEETGADFHLDDGQMLSDVVSGVTYGWEDWKWEIKHNGDAAGRAPLQYDLCWLWRGHWRRELATSIDPATGEACGPLVRFLIAVYELVMEEPLTPHQARYAVRKLQKEIPDPPTDEELAAEREAGRRALDQMLAMANSSDD